METTTAVPQTNPKAEAKAVQLARYFLLLGLASVLAPLTLIFGAIPMIASRRAFGGLSFWTGHMAVSFAFVAAGLPHYALIFFTLSIISGVFVEVEEHGQSVFNSGAISILATLGASALAVGVWLSIEKVRIGDEIRRRVTELVEQVAANSANATASITVESVLQQLPSAFVIALVLALGIGLLVEQKLLVATRLSAKGGEIKDRLISFRVPDAAVWLVMLVILGAFMKHEVHWLQVASMNILNILIVVYFFQGLAVVTHAFRTYQVSPFWQSLWYLVLILQLFLMVAVLGFVDFWMEFRTRLTRRPAETNKGF